MRESDLVIKEIPLVLKKDGRTKEEALAGIFQELRQEIYRMVPGTLIYMEPLEVKIEKALVESWTERFLWVLMPRQKRKYVLTVRVVVLVKYVTFADTNELQDVEMRGVKVG